MKNILTLILLVFVFNGIQAQTDTTLNKYIDNGLISIADKNGMSWQTTKGDFLFKPYTLIQTRGLYNYYDDEGLSLAEEDNVLNSGFAIPYALIGFAGKAFNKITFNVTLNAAGTGATILNQAWFDINTSDELRFRIGKFKTPFNQAYLVKNGQTLFPLLPSSLNTRVNVPFDINAVNPVIASGFDIGVQMHGILDQKFGYQLGIFNGTGITVNTATNSLSDDNGMPALLYAGRLVYMPFGEMPTYQGNPYKLNENYMLFGISGSYNVEANYESSNDMRAGAEFAMLSGKWYVSAEAYMLSMDFVERQQTSPVYTFWGAYAQAGYFLSPKIQAAARFDIMDRNSIDDPGYLYMPAVGFNYFLAGHNLKLQCMYQHLGKAGHESTALANDDDNSMTEHQVCLQLQFAF
ncbi:porin [Plebeiibacterium sediminum]|uniref:OprO/OprP family phosphate-selective porin n=1 Tax=Plebeiibacterium sediminum TaxID=2992112 RepID=A0AAE3SDR8_9BACT|nr:porin [Plebeiobacterium sediminum]MCW3785326.1 OprO/OprP family phosphate-selective porin [Plebeiobacterium sediminum]